MPGTWPAPLDPRLAGDRVILEPLRAEHGPGLRSAGADDEVWRWLGGNPCHDDDRFAAWLDQALSASGAGEESAFATLDAATGEPIGSTRYLAPRPFDRGVEIGWTWLGRPWWRTGANLEAKLLLMGYAFETLGCLRVEFKTDALNDRSRSALAGLPAQFEGIHRNHKVMERGRVRDSAWYSVIDREWPEVREGLRRRLGRI